MRHELLDHHQRIGWDIDGTLLGGPNSTFFRDYVTAHPEKEHHLITFRDEHGAHVAVVDLVRLGIPSARITSVNFCPQHLWLAWTRREEYYDEEKCTGYLAWKGETAKKLNCTVMVDDVPMEVSPGCIRNGVAFIDAFDPSFAAGVG